ncbi:MAG: ABC transporter substrate-binding protein, partial [Sphingopyxis sp.]
VTARLVPLSASADLRLIDEVAPSNDPGWYLRRLGCDRQISCDPAVQPLIRAVDAAADSAARATAIQSAEEGLMRHAGFIPLAAPLRWALTSDRTPGLRRNARGRHGLIHLQPAPN